MNQITEDRAFLQSLRHVNTQLGTVAILGFDKPIPKDWGRLTIEEGKLILKPLK